MQILVNSVQALAIEFAGPLVAAFSDAVNAALNFVHAIPVDAIKTLGEAIVAIATNQGLDVLRGKLAELASGNALQFFNSLLNFAVRVRQAIMEEIVPAIEAIARRVMDLTTSDSGLDTLARTFDTLGNVVLFVGGVIAQAITGIANWTFEFLSNRDAIERVIHVVEGLATVVVTGLVVAFVTLAGPMAVVLALLEAIGTTVDPLLGSFADLAAGAVTTSGAVGGSFADMADASAVLPEAMAEATDATTQNYLDIAEAAVGSAEVVSEASNEEADNVIADTNDMVQGQAEGWNASTEIVADSTENILKNINSLEQPFSNLERAPQNVALNWSAPLRNALDVLNSWLQAVANGINSLMQGLADNPLFQAVFAGAHFIGPIAIPLQLMEVARAGVAVHDAWTGASAAIDRIGRVTVPEITRATRTSTGELRSMLDGIAAIAGKARDVAAGRGGAANTEGGDYPTKPPKEGGGGKGGKGRGAGAGPEDAYNKALDQAEEFASDLAEKIQSAGIAAINRLEDIARRSAESAAKETRDYLEKVGAINESVDKANAEAQEAQNQSRSDRARKEELQKVLDARAQQRKFEREDRDQQLTDQREAEDRKNKQIQDILDRQFQLSQQNAATRRSRERQDEDTAFQRKLDDEERRIRKIEELQNKPGVKQTKEQQDAIRGGITLGIASSASQDELEKRRLERQRKTEDLVTARSRDRQDEDTRYEREQQQAAIDYRQGVEDKDYATRQGRAATDRARRRTDEIDDINFAQSQKDEQRKLDDQMEDEALKRRKDKAEKDRKDRLAIAEREHTERLADIRNKAAEEAQNVLGTLQNTIDGVEKTIRDKAPEIIKAGGEAMGPIMEAIVQNLHDQMDIVTNAAHDARLELGLALGTNGETVSESIVDGLTTSLTALTTGVTALAQAALAGAEALKGALPQTPPATPYNTGQVRGSVPNTNPGTSYSSPAAIGGGIPIGAPSELASSSTVVAPTASQVSITNNTAYNVSASYENSQSPASIGLDLSALDAITRR
jgi:hypothetical protein